MIKKKLTKIKIRNNFCILIWVFKKNAKKLKNNYTSDNLDDCCKLTNVQLLFMHMLCDCLPGLGGESCRLDH